ncbi:MAG: acyl carrier protein [Oscillospiraceae bacterium]|nr:acyl carrier protein [Candidatus Equicaccousia limihippi]
MSKSEILEKLTVVFRDVFDDETITISEDTTPEDIEGWDSLQHITLLSAIGEEFEYGFSLDQMIEIHSVKDMIAVLEEI